MRASSFSFIRLLDIRFSSGRGMCGSSDDIGVVPCRVCSCHLAGSRGARVARGSARTETRRVIFHRDQCERWTVTRLSMSRAALGTRRFWAAMANYSVRSLCGAGYWRFLLSSHRDASSAFHVSILVIFLTFSSRADLCVFRSQCRVAAAAGSSVAATTWRARSPIASRRSPSMTRGRCACGASRSAMITALRWLPSRPFRSVAIWNIHEKSG